MYRSKVVICGVNTSRLKVLSEEEKQALLLRMNDQSLDAAARRQARQDMILGNLRLVLSIIQRSPDAARAVGLWTICFRSVALGWSRRWTILTPPVRLCFPLTLSP